MNKQELIGKIIDLPDEAGVVVDTLKISRAGLIKLIDQFEEPKEKVAVPQFVADWYEEHKDDLETALFRCVDIIPRVYEDGELNQFQEWFISGETKPFQTLVNMHQFGYTVEKEKQYYVRFKGMESDDFNYLNFIKFQQAWVLSSIKLDKKFRTEHTKKQLEEAGFGWVFDCPGIEIEEVEE